MDAVGPELGYASPFDAALAESGPPGVFLTDRHGLWRLHGEWTRSAYNRAPGPHAFGWTWTLCRDRVSGFVVLVLVTSPTLLTEHPRMDVRTFPDRASAEAARAAWGQPPITHAPWEATP